MGETTKPLHDGPCTFCGKPCTEHRHVMGRYYCHEFTRETSGAARPDEEGAREVALTEALREAYGFAWSHGAHRVGCPLAENINAPDDTPCSCGYSEKADRLMDAEEALGFDFWQNARATPSLSAREREGGE